MYSVKEKNPSRNIIVMLYYFERKYKCHLILNKELQNGAGGSKDKSYLLFVLYNGFA